jgi:hypothetical protein
MGRSSSASWSESAVREDPHDTRPTTARSAGDGPAESSGRECFGTGYRRRVLGQSTPRGPASQGLLDLIYLKSAGRACGASSLDMWSG